MNLQTRVLPEPEFIARHDEEPGNWSISECPPERGSPSTDIVGREMIVPFDDDEVGRCIRAHEVMHSKVSPGTHWPEWLERGWASERAMRVVEEMRVNHLCNRAGIPVKEFLSDGKEKAGAERIAKLAKWNDAVYSVVVMAETASLPNFLEGIAKYQPDWVKPLEAITKKIENIFSSCSTRQLADTDTDRYSDIPYPSGFSYTERIAAWLDGISSLPLNRDENNEAKQSAGDGAPISVPAPISEDEIDRSSTSFQEDGDDDDSTSSSPGMMAWGKLNIKTEDLSRALPGSIARKRRPSATGRNPRRIHRLLTDPERRVFDVRSRGKGGIILIDASGSMHFSEDDIYKIVSLAPGALVAMYAEDEDGNHSIPNLHIIAKAGKMVSYIPEHQTGNNIDLPALQWAVAQRTSNKTPVIWVSDGQVTATNGEVYPQLGMQCIDFCRKERVMVASNVYEATTMLARLKTGQTPSWVWPDALKDFHRHVTGKTLQSRGH